MVGRVTQMGESGPTPVAQKKAHHEDTKGEKVTKKVHFVIASVMRTRAEHDAKQSRHNLLDCFVASVPRNDE